jgi:hypothetical protein
MTKPFPAGTEIGGYDDVYHEKGGIERTHWWCHFDYDEGIWLAYYVADEQVVADLFGAGGTPRAAFEQLVTRWTIANGGAESPTLRALLPVLRLVFEEDGSINPAEIVVKS